jgi:hypothetical protein
MKEAAQVTDPIRTFLEMTVASGAAGRQYGDMIKPL